MTYIGSMRNVHDYDLVCVCVYFFWGGGVGFIKFP